MIPPFINFNGVENSRVIDDIHGMTPLHMLSMNPHAPKNALAGNLLHANMEAAFWKDKQGKTPLDYVCEYICLGTVAVIALGIGLVSLLVSTLVSLFVSNVPTLEKCWHPPWHH